MGRPSTNLVHALDERTGVFLRISTLGRFQIDWLDPVTGQATPLPPERLHGQNAGTALGLLKALLSCPDRFATRAWLNEQFWPTSKQKSAEERLNDVVSSLRTLLRPKGNTEMFIHFVYGTNGRGAGYRLESYPHLWCDADAFEWHVKHAMLLDQRGQDSTACWERAFLLAEPGTYLPEQVEDDWTRPRRDYLQGLLRDCVYRWTALLWQMGRGDEAIMRLRSFWLEHLTDEDALRPLLEMLGERERFGEAEEYYEKARRALEEDGHGFDRRTQETIELVRALQVQRAFGTQYTIQIEEARVVEAERALLRPLSTEHALSSPETRSRNNPWFHQARIDWGEVPSHTPFYGREREQRELLSWIQDQQCRLILLYGMGGIGKTSLTVQLVNEAKGAFEYVFWRSLQHAPSLSTLLKDGITWLSDQQMRSFPETLEETLNLFLHYLQKYRCLVVFDNYETLLQKEVGAGKLQDEYQDYNLFFQLLCDMPHQSCLLLTSREKPQDMARFEGVQAPLRSFRLTGVGVAEGRAILQDKGVAGSDAECQQILSWVAGNPLALKLIAEPIRELFQADIAAFLQEDHPILHDMDDLLTQQFLRLSEPERFLLYWFAIERESLSVETLKNDVLSFLSKSDLLDALLSLQRRAFLEPLPSSRFTLQPVILEYITEQFVRQVCGELEMGTPSLLNTHALLKAQTKDFLRETQKRFILAPIAQHFGSSQEFLEEQAKVLLAQIQRDRRSQAGYLAGNVLNLLLFMRGDLNGWDFSHLTVRQAFLQGVHLPKVNFSGALLETSVFTDTFGSILSVAFHPLAPFLAAGTTNNDIRIWNLDGTPYLTLQGHTAWVRSIAWNNDGSLLASGGDDQTLRLWEIGTGTCRQTLHGHTAWVRSVVFHPHKPLLASGGEDQHIMVWDSTTGERLSVFHGHQGRIRSLAFSPDGAWLASAGEDHQIALWDLEKQTCVRTFRGHDARVRSVVFHPNGTMLASGSDDQTIRLWDSQTGRCLKILKGHSDGVRSLAFQKDGVLLASGSDDQTIRVWEMMQGQCLKTLRGHTNWVWSIAFQTASDLLASGGEDHAVRLWDTQQGSCLKTLQGYTNWAWAAHIHPEGTLLVAGCEDQAVRLWDLAERTLVQTLYGHTSRVRSIAFDHAHHLFATSSEDRTIRLWNSTTQKCIGILSDARYRMWSLAFHPDGHMLVGGGEDPALHMWDMKNDYALQVQAGHTDRIRSVAFNGNGDLLATGSEDQTIRIWRSASRECVSILHGHLGRVWSVAFHPHADLLASGGDDAIVYLWDTAQETPLRSFVGHTARVRCVLFSPDGQVCVSGSEDATLRLWETATGQCIAILQGHAGRVRSVTFHPQEALLASSSEDGTIKVWHTQTYQCLHTFEMDRPYAGMNIWEIKGLTDSQRRSLKRLGAIEQEC